MRKLYLITCLFALFFSSELFADDDYGLVITGSKRVAEEKTPAISQKINLKARPAANADYNCLPLKESYSEHIYKARNRIGEKKYKAAANYYKRHLKCWNDEAIYFELAKLYENQEKYYLAGLVYREMGNKKELKRINRNLNKNISGPINFQFKEKAMELRDRYLRKHRNLKGTGVTFMVLGSLAASAGLGLFIHDHTGGTNSKVAQYSLMLGGLTLLNSGLLMNSISNHFYNVYRTYGKISETFVDNGETTPEEYYNYSGLEKRTHNISSKTLKIHGASLFILSIPLFSIAIYGFFESKEDIIGDGVSGMEGLIVGPLMIFTHLAQLVTLAPGLISMIGGIVMLVKSSKWETKKPKETIFTLKSISPMINPITKTYGISMGFSF